jgi:hypothetical protein
MVSFDRLGSEEPVMDALAKGFEVTAIVPRMHVSEVSLG